MTESPPTYTLVPPPAKSSDPPTCPKCHRRARWQIRRGTETQHSCGSCLHWNMMRMNEPGMYRIEEIG